MNVKKCWGSSDLYISTALAVHYHFNWIIAVDLFLQQSNRTTTVTNDLEHLDLDSIATSTVAIPHDLVPSNAMDVYKNYDFEHHNEGSLPIAEHKDEVYQVYIEIEDFWGRVCEFKSILSIT